MRIRKRFPPPSPPSDLHLSRSAAAQPESEAAQPCDPPGQTSDNTRWARPGNDISEKTEEFGEDETWNEEQKKKPAGNYIRENNIPFNEECANNTFMQPSSSAAGKGGCSGTRDLLFFPSGGCRPTLVP